MLLCIRVEFPHGLRLGGLSAEDINRERIRNRLISCDIGVQSIATVILRIQLLWVTLTRQHTRQVHRMIKCPTRQYPLVHPFPCLLPFRSGITVPTEWHDGTTNRYIPRLLCISRNLRKGFDELVANGRLCACIVGAAADVVDTFEDHDPFGPRLVDCIALVTCEEGGTEAAGQHGIAAGGLVAHGDIGVVVGLQACENEIGPAACGQLTFK